MAIAILIGLLVLLVAGLVIALLAAKHAQRELEDLEDEFAEHRGVALDESDTPPWSPIDLDALRDDVTDVTGPDPYATLTGVDPAVTWNAAGSFRLEPETNGSEPEPDGFEPEPTGSPATTDLAPIKDLRPVAWRASADAPVVVLVVGAGFLGTGMTAGLTTADRLQRDGGKINDSFAETGVITLNPDPVSSAPSGDNGAKHEDVAATDTAAWPRPRRRSVDRSPPPEEELSRASSPRAESRPAAFAPPEDDDFSHITSRRAARRRADAAPPPEDDDFSQIGSRRAARRRADVVPPPEDEDFSPISSPRPRRRRADLLFPRPEEDSQKSSPPPRPRRVRPRPTADPEPITWRPPNRR
jgi:hypothetical protein